MGGFYDILHGGTETGVNTFELSLSVPDAVVDAWAFPPNRASGTKNPDATTLSVSFALDEPRSALHVASARFSRGAKTFVSMRWSDEHNKLVVAAPSALTRLDISPYNFIPDLALPDTLPENRATAIRLFDAVDRASRRAFYWHRLIADIEHIAPLRAPVPRFALLGRSGTTTGRAEGEDLVRLLSLTEPLPGVPRRRLLDAVDYWISERFEMLKDLRTDRVDVSGLMLSLIANDRDGQRGINVANMGEGISQLLPVIANVVLTRPGQTLLVEQPELHLHPSAQSDLGDLFAESVAGETGPQFIVETHSEHLLLRVRRHVAEGRLAPDTVSVLYIDKGPSGSRVKPLELDTQGHFLRWPRGFFEEGYNEALAIAMATPG